MVVLNNSSQMFGTVLSPVQSSSVLSHFHDLFLVLFAFSFVWFVLTIIVALFMVKKSKKKGQIMWTFIISLLIFLIVLFIASMNLGNILLWLGGI